MVPTRSETGSRGMFRSSRSCGSIYPLTAQALLRKVKALRPKALEAPCEPVELPDPLRLLVAWRADRSRPRPSALELEALLAAVKDRLREGQALVDLKVPEQMVLVGDLHGNSAERGAWE